MPDAETETKRALTSARRKKYPIETKDLLGTGSTVLNLACTGRPMGGFSKGRYFFFVGDSRSGKTFFSLTCLAEASINKHFDNYRFVYDNGEDGALMDIAHFFGDAVAERIEPPAGNRANPIYSREIDGLYFHLDDALSNRQPCIYIQDSMDVLSSKYEGKKFQERKTEARGGKKAKGDYGDGKAKANSSGVRQLIPRLRDTGSIFIAISQTRDNIDAGLFESQKTRSGGHALQFYASLEMWTSLGTPIKRTVRGKERPIGINVKIHVKKNRVTGRDRKIVVPILYEHGIDDIGGCVDFLIEEGEWKIDKQGRIAAAGFGFDAIRREVLIEKIQDASMEKDLRMMVTDVWRSIEAACSVKRKKRY